MNAARTLHDMQKLCIWSAGDGVPWQRPGSQQQGAAATGDGGAGVPSCGHGAGAWHRVGQQAGHGPLHAPWDDGAEHGAWSGADGARHALHATRVPTRHAAKHAHGRCDFLELTPMSTCPALDVCVPSYSAV